MISLIKNIYNSYSSLLVEFNDDTEPQTPPSSKNNIDNILSTDLIISEMLLDNRMYFGHNLQLLEKYKKQSINIVKNEIIKKYPDINFIFYHETKKIKLYDIGIIYVIHDDFNVVKDFVGINYTNNNVFNI